MKILSKIANDMEQNGASSQSKISLHSHIRISQQHDVSETIDLRGMEYRMKNDWF